MVNTNFLTIGEVSRAIRISREIYAGTASPSYAKQVLRGSSDMDTLMDAAMYHRRLLAVSRAKRFRFADQAKAIATCDRLLEVSNRLKRDLKEDWRPLEVLISGKSINSLIRQTEKDRRDKVLSLVKSVLDTIEKSVGAAEVRHVLTSRVKAAH